MTDADIALAAAEAAAASAETAGSAVTIATNRAVAASEASISASASAATAEDAAETLLTQKGANNGLAPLDGSQLVPRVNLPAATTTGIGALELATNAEVETGTDTARAVTPAGAKTAIDVRGGSAWVTGTSYKQGRVVVNPSGAVVIANVDHTAAASYATDTAKWDAVADVLFSLAPTNGKRSIGKDELVINVADYATVQAAFDAAAAGSTVYFPTATYAVPTGGYILKSNSLRIEAMGASFTVAAWGTPVFLALRANGGADGHGFRIGLVTYTGTRGDHTGTTVRGSAPYCSGSGVWTNGDRNYVEYLRTVGMPTPINFSSWDGTGPSDRMGVGNRIGYLEASGYDFGLLYVGQKAFDWGNAYLHNDIDDSGGVNPTHAIYCSGNSTLGSGSGKMGRWEVESNTGGHAFQFKYQDRLTAGALVADNTKGVLSAIDCDDLDCASIMATSQLSTGGAGCISFGVTTALSARANIGRIKIVQNSGVNERAVNLYADDAYVGIIDITSNRTVADGNDGELILRGSRNYVALLRTRAVGSASQAAQIGFSSVAGTDCAIGQVHAVNAFSMPAPVTITSSPGARYGLAPRDASTAAAPTDGGTWYRNTIVRNYAPSAGGSPGWVCTTAGTACAPWVTLTAVTAGAIRSNGANAYICTTAGTTGNTGGPTGTGTGITDGSAVWDFIGLAAVFKALPNVAA